MRCYLICLLLSALGVQAQSPKIDFLQQLLLSANDIQKITYLIELAIALARTSNEVAIQIAQKAFALSQQVKDSAGISRAGKILGMIYNRTESYTDAIVVLNKARVVAERKHYEDLKYILNTLGLAYCFQANYDKALACHLRSLAIRETQDNKQELNISLINVGFTDYKWRNYEKAVEYYTCAIELKLAEKDDYDPDRLWMDD